MDVFRNFRKHFPAHLTGQTTSRSKRKHGTATVKLEEGVVGTPSTPGSRHKFPSQPPIRDGQSPPDTHPTPSPSKGNGKGKQSRSDVRLGLQDFCIGVRIPAAAGLSEQQQQAIDRHLVRLFVIPSTSGLAAGYSVSGATIRGEGLCFALQREREKRGF